VCARFEPFSTSQAVFKKTSRVRSTIQVTDYERDNRNYLVTFVCALSLCLSLQVNEHSTFRDSLARYLFVDCLLTDYGNTLSQFGEFVKGGKEHYSRSKVGEVEGFFPLDWIIMLDRFRKRTEEVAESARNKTLVRFLVTFYNHFLK